MIGGRGIFHSMEHRPSYNGLPGGFFGRTALLALILPMMSGIRASADPPAATAILRQASATEALPGLDGGLDPERATLFNRFGGGFVSAAGLRSHYFDYGDPKAPGTILFLHGICGTGIEASCLAPHLTPAGFRLIAPDWPGAGLSDLLPSYSMEALVDWLEGFRAALGLERFILVGHSFGGFLASRYAASHPARVERLVLIDPAGYREELGPFLNAFVENAPAVGAAVALYDPWYFEVVSAIQVYRDRSRVSKEVLDYGALTLATEAGRDGIREIAVNVVGATPDLDCLSSIACPVLLFWGEEDRVLPYSFHRRFIRALPYGAVFRPVADCGHAPQVEFPDLVAADILSAVAGAR